MQAPASWQQSLHLPPTQSDQPHPKIQDLEMQIVISTKFEKHQRHTKLV